MSTKYQDLVSAPDEEFSGEYLRVELRPRTIQTMLTDEQIEKNGLTIIDEPIQFDSNVHEITRSKFQRQWLVEAPVAEMGRTHDEPVGWLDALVDRIESLRRIAIEEEAPFSDASEAAVMAFCRRPGVSSQPSVFLLGNGNLRLLWLNERQEQVGLQFRGDVVQYVLFRLRGEGLVQTFGADSAVGVLDTIARLGLMNVMMA